MDIIRIGLADDHDLFREGIKALLQDQNDINVMLEANNGASLLQKLETAVEKPDLVLLDIRMPVMDGYETATVILEKYPDIKIVVLTMHEHERHIIKMIELGVNGYLMKNANTEDVIKSIRYVMENDYYFDNKITHIMRKMLMYKSKSNNYGTPDVELTEREKEVLTLICKEYTAKEIGEKLFISHRTVEGHRKKLLYKLDVKNIAGLVVFALKNELVVLD